LIPYRGNKVLRLIKVSRPVLRLTEGVKKTFHLRVNQLKNEDDHSHVSRDEVKHELKHTPVPHITLWHAEGRGVEDECSQSVSHNRVAGISYGENWVR
jgi:hypothetical protein